MKNLELNTVVMFPSPIYGASFKLNAIPAGPPDMSLSFRPLYTGLVSNTINDIDNDYSLSCFRPLYTGLVSN